MGPVCTGEAKLEQRFWGQGNRDKKLKIIPWQEMEFLLSRKPGAQNSCMPAKVNNNNVIISTVAALCGQPVYPM